MTPAGSDRVSIYDIARVAGVNPSTVSRALNNRDRIGKKTRERVLQIARDLGYQPSAIARSLTTRRTNTIGVVAPSLSDPFMGMVVEGIERRAEERDYRVLFSTSQRNEERELAIARNFQRYSVDAVIIVTTHQRTTYQLFEKTLKVPVVLVGQEDTDSNIAVVTVDDNSAISTAVRYLMDLGHRSFAWVGVQDRIFSNTKRRDALISAAGSPSSGTEVHDIPCTGESDLERGKFALPGVIDSGATAAVCYNDMIAFGLMGAAQEQGLSVPGDLSVIGYDDLDISAFLPKPLTTIRQPRELLGREAVDIVLDQINGGERRRAVLQAEPIIRKTTGPPIAGGNGGFDPDATRRNNEHL